MAQCRKLTQEQGLFVGIGSGANVKAAEKYIEKYRPEGLVITVLPDSQNRYLSLLKEK